MYTSQISTILDYCSSIWVHIKASECDLVQNRAMRYFLGVHGFTPIPALNGEMGWLPCKFRRYLCAIRFWNRLQKMDNCRLTKVVFLWDLKNHKSNWSESVKNIFSYLDMTEDFMHQNIVNLKIVKSMPLILIVVMYIVLCLDFSSLWSQLRSGHYFGHVLYLNVLEGKNSGHK